MNPPNEIARCVALVRFDGAPVEPCATCALNIDNIKSGTRVSNWINITPAFWNGERYVCDKYMEIKNGQ